MEVERVATNRPDLRTYGIKLANTNTLWESTSMWKNITNPQPYTPHPNANFTAYLEAVPPFYEIEGVYQGMGTISPNTFHYTVDTTSQTFMRRVDSPFPKDLQGYGEYRRKEECLSMPIFVYKLKQSRGIKDAVLQDSTSKCDEIFATTGGYVEAQMQDKELNNLLEDFLNKDKKIASPDVDNLFDEFVNKDKNIASPDVDQKETSPDLDQMFNLLPESPVPPPVPSEISEPPTIPTDFLNDFKPQQIEEENLLDISNSDLKNAIRAQIDAERPRLRPRIREREEPEIIDLTQDEILNEPPSQRRRVEVETEAASNAATVNRSNTVPDSSYGQQTTPSETPFIDSLRESKGDLFSPKRVAMRQALYEMRKRYMRLPMSSRPDTFDKYVQQNVDQLKIIQEGFLAKSAVARRRLGGP
jgi:hypothetical protein